MAKCCFAKWFIALSYIEIHRFTVETVVTIPFVVLVSITIRSTWVISSPEFFLWNHKFFNVNFKRDCQIMVSRSYGNLWFVTSYFLCLKREGRTLGIPFHLHWSYELDILQQQPGLRANIRAQHHCLGYPWGRHFIIMQRIQCVHIWLRCNWGPIFRSQYTKPGGQSSQSYECVNTWYAKFCFVLCSSFTLDNQLEMQTYQAQEPVIATAFPLPGFP